MDNNSSLPIEPVRVANTTLQVTLYSIVGITSLFCNITFTYIIRFTNKMKTASNPLLTSLAISDLCIILVGLPLTIANLVSDTAVTKTGFLCQLQGYLLMVFFLTSNFNLTYIAIHRYLLIVRNTSKPHLLSRKRVVIGLVLAWLSGFIISLPSLVGWGRQDYNYGRAHCMLVWGDSISYLLFVQILSFTLPSTIIIYCYYKVVKYSNASFKRVKKPGEQTSSRTIREYRLTITLIIVVISFITIFMPYAILIWLEGFAGIMVSEWHSFIAMLMAYSNGMIDFFIYALMNSNFRRAVVSMWCWKASDREYTTTGNSPSTSV